jgi:hypothetical protein
MAISKNEITEIEKRKCPLCSENMKLKRESDSTQQWKCINKNCVVDIVAKYKCVSLEIVCA